MYLSKLWCLHLKRPAFDFERETSKVEMGGGQRRSMSLWREPCDRYHCVTSCHQYFCSFVTIFILPEPECCLVVRNACKFIMCIVLSAELGVHSIGRIRLLSIRIHRFGAVQFVGSRLNLVNPVRKPGSIRSPSSR